MSQFMLLIYETEADYEPADPAQGKQLFDEVMAAHKAFADKHRPHLRSGEALRTTATARTVRGASVTDGPFLETKEALGGYYVIEAADLAEAVEIARDCPARFGCVEVREVWDF